MVRSIIYNYRTNNEGNKFFDTFTVGEEYPIILDREVLIEAIDVNWSDMSATITASFEGLNDQNKPLKTVYEITQVNIHQVISEL